MQFVWLEKLASEGHVSQKAKDAIYADCRVLVKQAATAQASAAIGKLPKAFKASVSHGGIHSTGEALKAIGNWLAPMALLGGLGIGLSRLERRSLSKKTLKAVTDIKNQIEGDPDLSKHKEKAVARFSEIAQIAPTVAMMPEYSMRLIRSKLHEGLTDSDVHNLAILQSQYMPKLQDTMHLTESMKNSNIFSKTSAARLGETYADVIWLLGDAGIGSLKFASRAATTQRAAEEVFTPGSAFRRTLRNMLVMGSIPLLAGIGAGGVKVYEDKKNKKKLEESLAKSFKDALEQSDPNREPLHKYQDRARQAFQTLAHFAPHVATEPSAARAFMNKLVSYDMGIQPADVKDLSEIERNLGQTRGVGNTFFTGMAEGSEALGLKKLVAGSIEKTLHPALGFKSGRGRDDQGDAE